MPENIAVIDTEGQYAHLNVRTLRGLGKDPDFVLPEEYEPEAYDAAVLPGGKYSVTNDDRPGEYLDFNDEEHPPTLGICYGHQELAHQLGGTVETGHQQQYGPGEFATIRYHGGIFEDVPLRDNGAVEVLMSHGDTVTELPDGAIETATCYNDWQHEEPINAGFMSEDGKYWGVQFHPETSHTPTGPQIFENFLNLADQWNETFDTL